jgi:hypothetical protein
VKTLLVIYGAVAVSIGVCGFLDIEVSNSTLAIWVGILGTMDAIDDWRDL